MGIQNAFPLKLTTLTPFNYGHLAVNGGVSTLPHYISDRAIMFALCASLGMMRNWGKLPAKDYRGHISAMPWRASLFSTEEPELLAPLARRSDLGIEGGYPDNVRRAARSGNFKEFWTIQEVPHDKVYRGLLVSEVDPFELAGAESFVVRIGSNRTGMLQVERDDTPAGRVRLNASTAHLFGRDLKVEQFMLYELQATTRLSHAEAVNEMASWTSSSATHS